MAAGKNANFSKELQTILHSLGITKADVARRLNCSQMHVGNLVRGTRQATPGLINALSHSLLLSPRHKARLHRAAALDRGFEVIINLKPKPYKPERKRHHGQIAEPKRTADRAAAGADGAA